MLDAVSQAESATILFKRRIVEQATNDPHTFVRNGWIGNEAPAFFSQLVLEFADPPVILIPVIEVELHLIADIPARTQQCGQIVADRGQWQFTIHPPTSSTLRHYAVVAVNQIRHQFAPLGARHISVDCRKREPGVAPQRAVAPAFDPGLVPKWNKDIEGPAVTPSKVQAQVRLRVRFSREPPAVGFLPGTCGG